MRKIYRSMWAKQGGNAGDFPPHAAVFSEALFSERDDVAHGALGEMLPLNVATVAPTALESPRDQGNSSGRRKFSHDAVV
jgi:hypothetical protein